MSPPKRYTRLSPADPSAIAAAAACLRAGGLVAMPTETVYGLAANATDDRAVASIYAAKGRPSFNPLIAHVADADAAAHEGAFDDLARKLATAFWPGPLTIVAPIAPTCQVSLLARAGLDTLALRCPDHPVAQALIAAAGVPLAAPSANRSGRVSPTTAAHVAADLDGRIDWILDDGPARRGVESTIVACLGGAPRLLRPGALARERIEETLGLSLRFGRADPKPIAPGQISSHYAPRARLRLEARQLEPDEAGLDFAASLAADVEATRLDLSPAGDLEEAAAHLFAYLRELDASGAARIAVAPIPKRGLGAAINDRLARAAAPRQGDR